MCNSLLQFLRTHMCVDTEHFMSKLDTPQIAPFKSEILTLTEKFRVSLEHDNSEDLINDIYCTNSHLHGDSEIHEVFDSIRHAFVSYAHNGLHQLFTRQENEVWYPKIILKKKLLPNDISSLPNKIEIYRGTDKAEFCSKNYGQSWTTKKEVAVVFATQHYVAQPWYKEEDRLILKATIDKSQVLFSDQSIEFEVVVNIDALSNVAICT